MESGVAREPARLSPKGKPQGLFEQVAIELIGTSSYNWPEGVPNLYQRLNCI
jgi:hypothetical protein